MKAKDDGGDSEEKGQPGDSFETVEQIFEFKIKIANTLIGPSQTMLLLSFVIIQSVWMRLKKG